MRILDLDKLFVAAAVLLAIGFVVFVIGFVVYILHQQQKEIRYQEIVKSTSAMLQSLMNLNCQYNFSYDIKRQYKREKTFESKSRYDHYNCDDLFDCVVFNEYDTLNRDAKKAQKNQYAYENYLRQVSTLHSSVTPEFAAQFQIPFQSYREIEDKLFRQYQLMPIINIEIICIARYISPKGRSQYSKQSSHSIFEVSARYQELQKKIAQESSEHAQRKRERAKMSASLRYDILHRDGFKCQICGRTQADGVKLHVDHIIPVSKGGKTVKSNLRTLCDQCNLGKSNKAE